MSNRFRYRWTGSCWEPLTRLAQRCREAFTVGQIADLEITEERTDESHRHYFGCIRAAWLNLPEMISDRFASPEHLRKWCLIKRGYRNERTFPCGSKQEAVALAAFVQPLDDYAVVVPLGNSVVVMTAKSQKLRRSGDDGMLKPEFESSKADVLDECSKLIGVDVTTLLAQESPSIAPEHEREKVTA